MVPSFCIFWVLHSLKETALKITYLGKMDMEMVHWSEALNCWGRFLYWINNMHIAHICIFWIWTCKLPPYCPTTLNVWDFYTVIYKMYMSSGASVTFRQFQPCSLPRNFGAKVSSLQIGGVEKARHGQAWHHPHCVLHPTWRREWRWRRGIKAKILMGQFGLTSSVKPKNIIWKWNLMRAVSSVK